MRMRLICKCGKEGEWENDNPSSVTEAADKWVAEHRECTIKLGGFTAELLPSSDKKTEKSQDLYVF